MSRNDMNRSDMNRNDDFDATLSSHLHRQAPPQAPDRVLEAALQRVASQSQRRGLLDRLIGASAMTTFARATAVAAVLAVGVLLGLQFSNLAPNFGGTSPSPTVTQTSPSPSPTPTVSLPEGCVNPPVDLLTLIDATQTADADPVACYDNATLTFDANWVGGGIADCPAAPEPAWLACSAYSLRQVGDTRKVGAPQLFVAVDPAIVRDLPEPGTDVRVSGHFDDPASQTCHDTGSFPDESPTPVADSIERCRATFVVSEVVPLP
jgi:hypothetical protein